MTASEHPVYRHLLVGTDGSETAGRAVTHAGRLAAACGARLTIASAYERQDGPTFANPSGDEGPSGEAALAAAAANDHVVAGQALARAAGVASPGGRTQAGDPASALLDLAAELSIDLIVVGSRGMAAPSRFLLGSVPNRVSHHATCDVIVVRTSD